MVRSAKVVSYKGVIVSNGIQISSLVLVPGYFGLHRFKFQIIIMASSSQVQILDNANYSKHRVVTIPSSNVPALAPSSIRIRSKILGLTTNNLTYARMGHLMGWWGIFPQPDDTPAPYNDRSKYIRTPAWGYAEIIESTVPDIPRGKSIYGFLPIGNDLVDLEIKSTEFKNQIQALSEHRSSMWDIYSRYRVCPSLAELEKTKSLDFLGFDSLMWGLFATGYNMNKFAFAWNDANRIHPAGTGDWSAEDANLKDAAVVLLSASGKTGLSFAYNVRNNRPKEHQPKALIAVGSSTSKATSERSGYFDDVLLYSDAEAAKDSISKSSPRRIVLVDFGAREGVTQSWAMALSSLSIPFFFLVVGGTTKPASPEETTELFKTLGQLVVVNASAIREKGISVGGDDYFEELETKFDELKAKGGFPGTKLKWGQGLEEWDQAWESLCKDEVGADTGLVFRV